ncbi:DNA polymerase III subunit delta [Lentisphaera araneosa HTCC2155]|uniref:DNA polymerase III subunit delta n=1 Tax=Lentisphaera araneosa HTCC2155 TaxID=313628 RepID=A6DR90_9BACT|nr:hypothetical protein [Lentisphaera araneosa]EDM25837.1 DNA polymerase III subunit delta [Lentisphaera araneosa HTCC2155]
MGFKNNHNTNEPVLRRGSTTKTPDAPPSISFGQSTDKTETPSGLPHHHEVVMSILDDTLSIPTLTILDSLPKDCLHQNWHSQLDTSEPLITFNKEDILNVLQQGTFRITVGPLACLLPNTLVTAEGYHSTAVTELPLDELLEVIPKDWFKNPYQSCALDETIAAMDNPFELEDTVNSATHEYSESADETTSIPVHTPATEPNNRLPKPTVLPQSPKNNHPDMAITQEMELQAPPDFISSSQPQYPETAQFSVSDFWDKENNQAPSSRPKSITAASPISEPLNPRVTKINNSAQRRRQSSVFDLQEPKEESVVLEVDETVSSEALEISPHSEEKFFEKKKTDFDLSTLTPVQNAVILEDPKQTVCMYNRPTGDIVVYAECISFSTSYILAKLTFESSSLNPEEFLEIPQQDILNIIKKGTCSISQETIHQFLKLPNGSPKTGDLDLPLTDILELIPNDWYLSDQSQELENVLKNMGDVFTEKQLEQLADSKYMEAQLENIDDQTEESTTRASTALETATEPMHDEETQVYPGGGGSLLDNLIGANSSIMGFLQESDDEATGEVSPMDTSVLDADKSGLENDIKTHKTIHIGLSKDDAIKEATPIKDALTEENTSVDFVDLDVEDEEVGKKAEKGITNSHFRKPPKTKTVVSNEYDMELHSLIENREQELNPHSIPHPTPPERKATKKSDHPHTQECASVAPNGIHINQCTLDDLLLICNKELAQKVLDARTEPYPSLESLKHQAQLSNDEYHSLTGLSAKEYHIQKETYLFSIAGETNDSSVNTFIKQLKDKCEFDFVMLSTLDGLNITDCGTTNSIDKEELAAYIPKLISTKKDFLENTNIPQAQDFSFYLGDNCLSVSIAGNVYFTCIHSSPWPNTNQLKFLHSLRDLVAWYFSHRLIL